MRRLLAVTATVAIALIVLIFPVTSAKTNKIRRAFYSEEEAKRGLTEYANYCAKCHLENLGGSGSAPGLVGSAFMRDFYTVGDFYSKVSMSMPADNVHGLSDATYLDIVAYLLKANGLPAGKKDLKPDVNEMKEMVLSEGSAPTSTTESQGISPNPGPGEIAGYYTQQQAERGKAYFHGACSLCHTTDQRESSAPPPDRGMVVATRRGLSNLGAGSIGQRFHSVGNLYLKISTTMPGNDYGGLSKEEYLDIAAFLLQANGYPPGKEPLKDDVVAMQNMSLVEKGFQPLFNGRDLSGFGFMLGNNCKPRPQGCGQTEPGTTYRVENGMVLCSGKPQGYMYTQKKYLNFTLRLDYRYVPYPGLQDDDNFYGNSGYLLFITENQVWPKMIEIQGANSSVLSIISDSGIHSTYTVDADARKRALKPVGQWNAVEIVSKNQQVRSYLNGLLISTITQHDGEAGYIGFQSEGAAIYWRNIRLKEE